MTLVVVAEGSNFIVLAADTKGTWTEADGSRMESLTEEKLVQLTDYSAVLIAGDSPQIGIQLIEEFKRKHTTIKKWGVSKVVAKFCKYCKKEFQHISDTIPPTSKVFPNFVLIVSGLDKAGGVFVPKINSMNSCQVFMPGRWKNNYAEGKPFIARYILSREYKRSLSAQEMCFVVAKALKETSSIDGDVGTKMKMAIITKNGYRPVTEEATNTFLAGKEEYERVTRENQEKELERIQKE